MRFLHDRGILHRDLKADNIFVSLDAEGVASVPYIGDFDVALNVVGTRFWRAPEVLQALKEGRRPVFTPQADVYSFAMTCYEILTGDIPFKNERFFNYDVVLSGQRPKLPSNLNPKMVDLMNRCWHQDPSMRPTFGEILEELKWLHREFFPGQEFVSRRIDEYFVDAKRSVDLVGADPESCFEELKELIQTLVPKFKQADSVAFGQDLVADMEEFHSQFGSRSFSEQEQPPAPIPYSQWFPRLVLSGRINWKSELFFGTLPLIREVARMRALMLRILGTSMALSACSDDDGCTGEEKAARVAEVQAWMVESGEQMVPENSHRKCLEELEKGFGEFQVCDVCQNAHDEYTVDKEAIKSTLYVDSGSILKKLLPPSMLHVFP